MRVLLVSALPPPEGGAAAWTSTIVDQGLPEGFDLELVDSRVARSHWAEPTRPTPGEFRRLFRIWRKVNSRLKSGEIDVLHVANSPSGSFGVFRDLLLARSAHRHGIPLVVQLHGRFQVPSRTIAGRMKKAAFRGLFSRSARILTSNDESSEAIAIMDPALASKIEKVPNFIVEAEMPRSSQLADLSKPLHVVYAGTMTSNKGIETILEVVRRVRDVRFTLVGAPTRATEAMVNAAVSDPAVRDRVKLTGQVSMERSRQEIASGDVFIFPSKHEGFPISVMEAMTAGLAFVGAPVGAIPDMIDVPAGGILIDGGDIESYTNEIERLARNRDIVASMGKHNRQKALAQYDYPKAIAHLCRAYELAVR